MGYLITYAKVIKVLEEKFNFELNYTDIRQILPHDTEKRIIFVSVEEKYLADKSPCDDARDPYDTVS